LPNIEREVAELISKFVEYNGVARLFVPGAHLLSIAVAYHIVQVVAYRIVQAVVCLIVSVNKLLKLSCIVLI